MGRVRLPDGCPMRGAGDVDGSTMPAELRAFGLSGTFVNTRFPQDLPTCSGRAVLGGSFRGVYSGVAVSWPTRLPPVSIPADTGIPLAYMPQSIPSPLPGCRRLAKSAHTAKARPHSFRFGTGTGLTVGANIRSRVLHMGMAQVISHPAHADAVYIGFNPGDRLHRTRGFSFLD